MFSLLLRGKAGDFVLFLAVMVWRKIHIMVSGILFCRTGLSLSADKKVPFPLAGASSASLSFASAAGE